jgi:cytochrome c oxidase subunit 2
MTSIIAASLAYFFQEKPKFPESDSFWMPKEASTLAPQTDWLFYFIYWASVVSVVLIVAAMAYFVVKYRAKGRSKNDPFDASESHNNTLEIVWSIGPLIIVVAVFVFGFEGFMNLRTPPKDSMEIQVTGQKWNWTFTYPNGASDNELHVPVNKPVRLVLTSVDVIHSVWIPTFRVKMDAVPGRYTDLWFQATEAGEFPLECTEYCGTGHSDMLTKVIVHEPGGYETWLATAGNDANLPPAELGKKLYEKKGCAACHSIDGTKRVGPSFKGIWGKQEPTNVGPVQVNEDYIRESLLEPQAKIVAGYAPAMPTFKGQLKDTEISGLIEYIKTLK